MIMSNIVTPLAAAGLVLLAAAGVEAVRPSDPTQASLKSLTFENGQFRQEFYVTGAGFIEMIWAAEINRGTEQLCSGGGKAPYRNQVPKRFSPSDWTFDECPPLEPGDEAFAVWSYEDENGVRIRFEGVLTITEDQLG